VGDRVLALGRPGNEVVTKKNSIARGRTASVRTASPIRTGVDNQFFLRRRSNEQAHMKGATYIHRMHFKAAK
jgi:hypothetical protein